MDYCQRSAASVGRVMMDIHGESDHADIEGSDALCNALQVLNHLQDCGEDYLALDRVYVPEPWLQEAGGGVEMLAERRSAPAVRQAVDRCLEHTAGLLRRAEAMPGSVRRRRFRWECAVIVRLAWALHRRLSRAIPSPGGSGWPTPIRVGLALSGIAGRHGEPGGQPADPGGLRPEALRRRGDARLGQLVLPADDAAAAREARGDAGALRLLPRDRRRRRRDRGPGAVARADRRLAGRGAGALPGRAAPPGDAGARRPGRALRPRRAALHGNPGRASRWTAAAPCCGRRWPSSSATATASPAASACSRSRSSSYRARTIPTFARHLGQAFQLTNILRDVAEDARRGRIYLPRELLERHGLAGINPEAVAGTPGVEKVCGALGGMARRHFGAASEALPRSERRSMRPAILMRSVYEAYLDRIERAGFPVSPAGASGSARRRSCASSRAACCGRFRPVFGKCLHWYRTPRSGNEGAPPPAAGCLPGATDGPYNRPRRRERDGGRQRHDHRHGRRGLHRLEPRRRPGRARRRPAGGLRQAGRGRRRPDHRQAPAGSPNRAGRARAAFLAANAGSGEDAVFHLGATSSTTETDASLLARNNYRFSMDLWRWCAAAEDVPLIYASSAATYGDGGCGFDDDGSDPGARPAEAAQRLRPQQASRRPPHRPRARRRRAAAAAMGGPQVLQRLWAQRASQGRAEERRRRRLSRCRPGPPGAPLQVLRPPLCGRRPVPGLRLGGRLRRRHALAAGQSAK